jgi:signal transduction histidine kinase
VVEGRLAGPRGGALAPLIRNLVENAIRYNTPDGWISIRVSPNGDAAVLTVDNTGPVVSQDQIPALPQAFHRSSHRRTGSGAGLGHRRRHRERTWREVDPRSPRQGWAHRDVTLAR